MPGWANIIVLDFMLFTGFDTNDGLSGETTFCRFRNIPEVKTISDYCKDIYAI